MAQVSLRWLLQKKTVVSVIFGAKTREQLETNLGAASGWNLSQGHMDSLDEISKMTLEYPYDMVARHSAYR